MTALDIRSLLERTQAELESLRDHYASLRRDAPGSAPSEPPSEALESFADFLTWRETQTLATFDQYLGRDADQKLGFELDVHVRLGHGFPLGEQLSWPSEPDLDALISLARASDDALEQLTERVRVYASGERVTAMLEAIDEHVRERRTQLARATHELERFESSAPA